MPMLTVRGDADLNPAERRDLVGLLEENINELRALECTNKTLLRLNRQWLKALQLPDDDQRTAYQFCDKCGDVYATTTCPCLR